MNLHLRLTNSCNLRCISCWGPPIENNQNVDASSILNFLSGVSSQKRIKKITITGGEPTKNPDFAKIINLAKQYCDFLTISTNAYCIPSAYVKFMLQADRVQVPLDGLDDATIRQFRIGGENYLAKLHDFVNHLIGVNHYNGILKFGTVLHPGNVHQLLGISKYIKKIGYKKVEWRIYEMYGCQPTIHDPIDVMDMASFPVSFQRLSARNDKYIFFNPSGDISVIQGNKELVIASIDDYSAIYAIEERDVI